MNLYIICTTVYKSTDYFDRTVAVTVLPEDKNVQKMPNCGSIGPNFAGLLNNIGDVFNVDCYS